MKNPFAGPSKGVPSARVESEYVVLKGGLDRASSPLAVKPGRLLQCLNFEELFDKQGYSMGLGYERFSGKESPSDATYTTLTFDAGGFIPIVVGSTVTNAASATGEVVSITLTSGSWAAGDAAGTMILTLTASSWADNAAIKVGGVQRALANGVSVLGTRGDATYETSLKAARSYLRSRIAAVTGSGGILGVAVYRETVYAVRNAADGLTAVLWKSSTSGWTSVKTGLIPGGAWRFNVANFSGASTTLALFAVDGKNRLLKYDGTTVTSADPIYGSEALSSSAVLIGTGAKTFTLATASRNYANGDALTIWSTADRSNWMAGTVSAYNSGTNVLDMTITSVGGAGTPSSWEVGRTDFQDKPFLLTDHRDHMFLGYPLGQLQTSALGDPMLYTGGTVALFGMGAELTGLVSLKGGVLVVFCREKIEIIEGSTSADWTQRKHTVGAGAVENTAVDVAGNAMFLDDVGVLTLQSSQSFGDFDAASLTRAVGQYLSAKIADVMGARIVKASNQYRLYFTDGDVLTLTITTENPVPTAKDISPTRQNYPDVPTCFAAGVIGGVESIFFGTGDGYVMQEGKGPTHDGVAIEHVILTHFNHFKSPEWDKQFPKLTLELNASAAMSVSYRLLFDYDNGVYRHSNDHVAEVLSPGGQFDVDSWDAFTFDGPLRSWSETNPGGVGRNAAVLLYIENDFDAPATLQGLMYQFIMLGMKR